MKRDFKLYWKLFTSVLYVSTFMIGPGYVAIPLMKRRFEKDLGWVDSEEMADFVAIGQSVPGPLSTNTLIQLGYKMGGVLGILTAIFGAILIPMILTSLIQIFYSAFISNPYVSLIFKGMNAAVVAIMVDITLSMGMDNIKSAKHIPAVLIAVSFLLAFVIKVNVMLIMLGGVAVGVAYAFIIGKKEKKDR